MAVVKKSIKFAEGPRTCGDRLILLILRGQEPLNVSRMSVLNYLLVVVYGHRA